MSKIDGIPQKDLADERVLFNFETKQIVYTKKCGYKERISFKPGVLNEIKLKFNVIKNTYTVKISKFKGKSSSFRVEHAIEKLISNTTTVGGIKEYNDNFVFVIGSGDQRAELVYSVDLLILARKFVRSGKTVRKERLVVEFGTKKLRFFTRQVVI